MAAAAKIVSIGIALWVACTAQAGPLDLADDRQRLVEVRFETSGQHQPAQLDRVYGDPVLARLSPGPGEGEVTVRVEASEMERSLHHHDPVPDSFSDFVWVFDAATGDVISADLTGQFFQKIDWGFLSTRVAMDTKTRLSTREGAGHREPRQTWGHLVFEYCDADEPGCLAVPPRSLDPATGYVNAVGSIKVRAVGGIGTTSFSPLGEAIFSELETEATAVSLGPPAH